jgi:multisubunit Na+/H+ antiporter MnhB subunit
MMLAFDSVLAAVILVVAGWTIAARETFPAVVGFIAFGILTALVWVRLAAVDVALTEAAIGSGVTGVLFLRAALQIARSGEHDVLAGKAIRWTAAALSVLVTVALATVVLYARDPAPSLALPIAQSLHATGLGNPVTAVLMAFRAIDTFLEKVVLLFAVVGVWSLASDRAWGNAPSLWTPGARDDALTFMARVLPPVGVVIGLYIFWTSADNPGGAFQGGAILAAMWMLAIMARLAHEPPVARTVLRICLVVGPATFLAVGLAGFAIAGGFLAYPEAYSKTLIVTIEAAMIVTIAVTLAMLVAGPPVRGDVR